MGTATMQAQSPAHAASVSASVTSATSSGALTTALNSHLASSGYTGAAIQQPTITVTTSSTSSTHSGADNTLIYGLVAGAGVLMIVGIAAGLLVYRMNVDRNPMGAITKEEQGPLTPRKSLDISGLFQKHSGEHSLRTSMDEME